MFAKSALFHFALLVSLLQPVLCTVPVILYSHLLVPKIQSYVNNFAHLEFPIERLNEVTKKLIEPCSSDAYVLVNHPGLTLEDLQDPSSFTFLRTYMLMSSTLGAIPRAEKPIDFEKLEMFANSRCGVLSVEVNGLQEAPTYIDTRTRFIKVNLPRLPDDPMMRKEALLAADEALRHTLRKLPSPHHTLIYTTLDNGPVNKLKEKKYEKMDIFPDITREPSRNYEVERNIKQRNVEPYFHPKRTGLLDKSIWEAPKFLDAEFLIENELLVIGIVLITAGLIITQFLKLVIFLVKKMLKTKKDIKLKKEK